MTQITTNFILTVFLLDFGNSVELVSTLIFILAALTRHSCNTTAAGARVAESAVRLSASTAPLLLLLLRFQSFHYLAFRLLRDITVVFFLVNNTLTRLILPLLIFKRDVRKVDRRSSNSYCSNCRGRGGRKGVK